MQEIGHFKVLGAFIDGILSRDEYQGRGIPHKHFLVPAIDKTGLDRDEMVQMIMDLIRTIRIEINRTVEKSSHMVIPNRAYKKVVKDVADTFIEPKKSKHISQQATKALPAATEGHSAGIFEWAIT
jgi:histone H3/H4